MSQTTVDLRARISFDKSEGEWTLYLFGNDESGRYAWLSPGGQRGGVIVVCAPGKDGVRGPTMSLDYSAALKTARDWVQPEEAP